MRWVWLVLILVRLAAGAVLVLGPFTDEPAELAGWDVERFQEIAEAPGRPWVDQAVEYPPGSVAAIDIIARDDLVSTHNWLVVASLTIDFGIALGLRLTASLKASLHYLILGLPLIPTGYLRFDLWAVGLALIGFFALLRRNKVVFGLACAAGAMVKLWPALLMIAAVATKRFKEAIFALAIGSAAAAAWVGFYGTDTINQVLSLRGATGWHIESLPGTIMAGVNGSSARLELNAFRVGTMNQLLVVGGRLAVLAAMGFLAFSAVRTRSATVHSTYRTHSTGPTSDDSMRQAGLVMLGSVAALLISSPLLSPQFFLWLTPWAALSVYDDRASKSDQPFYKERRISLTTLALTTTTGAVLAAFGPSGVDQHLPALLLLARNLGLGLLVWFCIAEIRNSRIRDCPTGTLNATTPSKKDT